MATAAMKVRAHSAANGGVAPAPAPESVSMEFLIVEDNGGRFHWTLLDRDGHDLARSPNFVSHQDAEDAALVVLAGVGSARLDRCDPADDSLDIPSNTEVPTIAKVPTIAENGDGSERGDRAASGAPAARTA